jgi:tRNA(Ile)-lysidine synthase
LNFTRGSGISGLRGIKKQNQKIIRPLLDVSRKEIELYAASNNLSWREDSSNKSTDYHRNFIRHQVIPKLKEINPSLESTYTDNAKRFSAEEELVNFAIKTLGQEFILLENNQIKIQKRLFNSFTNKAPILWEIIKDYGFNLDQCERIVSGSSGQSGKHFSSATHSLIIDREVLIITELFAPANEIVINEHDAFLTAPNFELKIQPVDQSELKNDPLEAVLDIDKIKYPLLLRPWRKGDGFHPLGMSGAKKVSDFLIDIKLSIADKNQVWVLESDGKIAWVVGLRIDDRFKITPETKSALSFKKIR